ncbi:hypothetical protein Tco_1523524 [Tanacetum coccineum]
MSTPSTISNLQKPSLLHNLSTNQTRVRNVGTILTMAMIVRHGSRVVEDLVPIPSESEGIFDNMCDVPSCDKKHFDAESDLMESLLNRDTPFVYSPKIDSLLEEFAAALINPIPPGIHEADFDPKEDIRLDDQMFYDYTLSDDDYFEDIDYIEASPPDSELVSIEEVEYDILRAKLSNNYLLIAKIESLNDNPTLSFFSHSDNSLN